MNFPDESDPIIQERSQTFDNTNVNQDLDSNEEFSRDSETLCQDLLTSHIREDCEFELSMILQDSLFDENETSKEENVNVIAETRLFSNDKREHDDDDYENNVRNEEDNYDKEEINMITKPHSFDTDDENDIKEKESRIKPLFHENKAEDCDFRKAVKVFYSIYNPEKINTIDTILEQYGGYELQLILHLIEKYEAVEKCDLDVFSECFNEIDLLQIAKHQIVIKKQSNICTPTKELRIEIGETKDDKPDTSTIGGRLLKNWTNAAISASPSWTNSITSASPSLTNATTNASPSNRKISHSNIDSKERDIDNDIIGINGNIRNLNLQVSSFFENDII
jgi:hypothetical protein